MSVEKEGHTVKVVIQLEDLPLERVKKFCYLGNTVTQNNKHESEVKKRIALTKQAFQNKENLFTTI